MVDLDANRVAIIVGIASSVITAAVTGSIAFAALKSWMARREEREASMQKDVDDHETRIRQLERDLPPFDYPRR